MTSPARRRSLFVSKSALTDCSCYLCVDFSVAVRCEHLSHNSWLSGLSGNLFSSSCDNWSIRIPSCSDNHWFFVRLWLGRRVSTSPEGCYQDHWLLLSCKTGNMVTPCPPSWTGSRGFWCPAPHSCVNVSPLCSAVCDSPVLLKSRKSLQCAQDVLVSLCAWQRNTKPAGIENVDILPAEAPAERTII